MRLTPIVRLPVPSTKAEPFLRFDPAFVAMCSALALITSGCRLFGSLQVSQVGINQASEIG